MASIEKRGINSWRLIVEIGTTKGRRRKRTKTLRVEDKSLLSKPKKLKEHLNEQLLLFKMEVESGEYIVPENRTLASFIPYWEEKYARDALTFDTLRDYTNILNTRILPIYGDMKLSDIKTMHILDFVNDLRKDGQRLDGKPGPLASSTINNCYKAFNNVLARAAEWKFIKENPAAPVKPPKVKHKKSDVYSKEDVSVILDLLKQKPFHWEILVLLALSTGAREGEIAALEWKHVNFDKATIYIEQAIAEVKGEGVKVKETKTDRERTVSIPAPLVSMMKKLKAQRNQEKFMIGDKWEWPDHHFIFCNEFGKPIRPDSISQWWRRFTQKADVKYIRFHDLRHTSATLLINEGVHAKVIQERLGHSKIGTTMNTYGHVLQEADQSAAAHFDSFFEAKSK
ncbi:site-specific integrase [Bacillus infantis]|uniref:tyrosine-type recombinase/integrase n=1 Tax=Bacillus infantis TaxID=324767 RepID=UPI003450979D